MNILIIEDESLAADRLEKILNEIAPDIKVLAKLGSVKESVKWLMLKNADLIFLDIQLSDGISFSIFEQVTINTPVIFTTAYDQYAIKAFHLNSVSYLLKPIRKNELSEALKKFKSLRSAFSIDFDNLLSAMQGKQSEYRKRFLIQIGDKFRKIETSDIAYFYACDKNVFLKTFEGNSYPVELSLEGLENTIDPSQFFRINRRYLINIRSITNMHVWSRSRIKIVLKPQADNEMDTIVSIDRSADFKKWMNK
ncbi:MAG: response regulator transcription factor [Bacteroidetes bacterium]|nr:MAG: response regulator transcription factor [Bacteroidota bacterium]